MTQPFPNAYSHPLPRFRYHRATGRVTVEFENDPTFAGSTTWCTQTFYLIALPRRRSRTLLDNASDVLSSAHRCPSLATRPSLHMIPPPLGPTRLSNLHEDEVEQDHGEDAEVMRVIAFSPMSLK